jgi:hypothetical protein
MQSIIDGEDATKARAVYVDYKLTLTDDYAFLAQCNIGGEFMSDDDADRLKVMGEKTGKRDFIIHLGLAHE